MTNAWRVCFLTFITCEHRQCCFVWNTGDFEDSKSTSGGILCIFASRTLVPISWMCKKQTSVSHGSAEADVISLDAVLRMDEIPVLYLWDFVIEVFHSSPNQTNKTQRCQRATEKLVGKTSTKHAKTYSNHAHQSRSDHFFNTFQQTEHILVPILCCLSLRTVKPWKLINKGRSPTRTHVSRAHRDALDRLFDTINLVSKIQIGYIVNKHQLADTLTKRKFTRTNGPFFFSWSTSAISAPLAALRNPVREGAPKRWRKGCRNKKGTEKVCRNLNVHLGE